MHMQPTDRPDTERPDTTTNYLLDKTSMPATFYRTKSKCQCHLCIPMIIVLYVKRFPLNDKFYKLHNNT